MPAKEIFNFEANQEKLLGNGATGYFFDFSDKIGNFLLET